MKHMNKFITNGSQGVKDIIQKALHQKRYELFEAEAKQVIQGFGIATPRHAIATSPGEALQAADSFGYPLVLKIVSPDISHKTEAGGVKVGIKSEKDLLAAYEEIMDNVKKRCPSAAIHGILIQEMAASSAEVIVGGLRDPQFGPAVMFGMGGVFVEVYKDVSFRIAPVEEYEVWEMIGEVKGAGILKGFRNMPALDIPAVVQTIIQVSTMMMSVEEINEVDLNPIFVYPKGAIAVDARIILNRP